MFKFRIDPADIQRTKVLLEKQFQKVCEDPAMLADQGKFLTERIRYQDRITKPLNAQGALPALQASTVRTRRYLAKYNRTDITYEVSRSNLTLTGAFFNSLGFNVTGPGEITLEFKGVHPGYKTKSGGPKGEKLKNSTIAGYLREKGFSPFDVPTLQENQTIRKRMSAIVKAYLRRALKLS